jgi:hypothetical protein
MTTSISIAVFLTLVSAEPEPAPPPPTPVLSSELLDSKGLNQFHLATRVTFADSDSAFSSSFIWAYEARTQVRIIDGLAVHAIAPFGLFKRGEGTEAYFGNLTLGLGGGGEVLGGAVSLRLGGGIDGHLPTSSGGDSPEGASALAAIRAYEPQLFVPKLGAVRGRGSVELAVGDFRAQAEISIIPAFTTKKTEVLFLIGGALRASYMLGAVEPFLELGGATQVAGPGDIAPPFLLTPGVRFHVADLFDPAIFVSFNFVEGSAVIFGVDLALAFRPSNKKKSSERDILDSRDDFL